MQWVAPRTQHASIDVKTPVGWGTMTREGHIAGREVQRDDGGCNHPLCSRIRFFHRRFTLDSLRWCFWHLVVCSKVRVVDFCGQLSVTEGWRDEMSCLLWGPSAQGKMYSPRTVVIPIPCDLNLWTWKYEAVHCTSSQFPISKSPVHRPPACKTYPMRIPDSILVPS